jgi:hypothetical protein
MKTYRLVIRSAFKSKPPCKESPRRVRRKEIQAGSV